MSHNNSYASSVKASDGNYYTYSDVFSEGSYTGGYGECTMSNGYKTTNCVVKCSCNKWSSSSSGMIRPISATSGYYSDNGGTVTCYKDLGCPDGYYEDEPESKYFTYTSTASNKCFKVTGCSSSYSSTANGAAVATWHGTSCYNKETCPSGYFTTITSESDCGTSGSKGWELTSSGSVGGVACRKCVKKSCPSGWEDGDAKYFQGDLNNEYCDKEYTPWCAQAQWEYEESNTYYEGDEACIRCKCAAGNCYASCSDSGSGDGGGGSLDNCCQLANGSTMYWCDGRDSGGVAGCSRTGGPGCYSISCH